MAFGLGYTHALAGTGADQVGFELGTIASTWNSSRPTGSVGSYTDPPKLVDVNAFNVDTEFGEPVALCGEVLFLVETRA